MFDALLILLNICVTAWVLLMLGRAEKAQPSDRARLFDMPAQAGQSARPSSLDP